MVSVAISLAGCASPFATGCDLAHSIAFTGTSEVVWRAVTNGQTFNVFVANNDLVKSQGYSIAVRIQ